MQITTQEENRLLHLMLEMGEKLLESGAEIKRVEDTLERIGFAYDRFSVETLRKYGLVPVCDLCTA